MHIPGILVVYNAPRVTVSYKMIRYAVVLENGLLYELVGRLGVKKQKKKWKTCSKLMSPRG